MNFVDAVDATPTIREHLKADLQAIGPRHRANVGTGQNPIHGSVDIDRALRDAHPSAARWDFVVGVGRSNRDTTVWIEVHSADSLHVDEVLQKLKY